MCLELYRVIYSILVSFAHDLMKVNTVESLCLMTLHSDLALLKLELADLSVQLSSYLQLAAGN